jgi:hypothetical protein
MKLYESLNKVSSRHKIKRDLRLFKYRNWSVLDEQVICTQTFIQDTYLFNDQFVDSSRHWSKRSRN